MMLWGLHMDLKWFMLLCSSRSHSPVTQLFIHSLLVCDNGA